MGQESCARRLRSIARLTAGTSSCSRLWIADHPDARGVTINRSPRIGLGKAKDLLLRFFITGNQYVSKSRGALLWNEVDRAVQARQGDVARGVRFKPGPVSGGPASHKGK